MPDYKLSFIIDAQNKAKAAFEEAGKQFKDLKKDSDSLKDLGKGLAIAGGVITGAVGLMVKSAADAQLSWAKVSQEVKLAGLNIEDAIPAIQKFASAQQNLTGTSDELIGEFVGRMLPITKDVGVAFEATSLAMDLAAGTGKDFSSMQNIMSMVMSGNIEALKRYLPELRGLDATQLQTMSSSEKVSFAMEAIRKQFGGLAEAEGKTASKQFQLLKQTVEDLAEKIGGFLLPVVQKITAFIVKSVEAIQRWVDEHKILAKVILIIVASLGVLLTTVGTSIYLYTKVTAMIGTIKLAFTALNAQLILAKAHMIAFTLASAVNPFVAFFTIITAVGVALYKVYEAAKAVGGIWNALKLTWYDVTGQVEKYNDLAVKVTDTTKKQKTAQEEIDEMLKKLSVDTNKLGDDSDATAEKIASAYKEVASVFIDIEKQIIDVQKQYADAQKSFEKDSADSRNEYYESIAKKVAEVESDIVKLQADRILAIANGNDDEVANLDSQIKDKQGIIATYNSWNLGIDAQVAEQKKYLAMNELEQLKFDYDKKSLIRQVEYLQAQAQRLQEQIDLQSQYEFIISLIGKEQLAYINAEKEKSKSLKDRLLEGSLAISAWITENVTKYKDYATQVSNAISSATAAATSALAPIVNPYDMTPFAGQTISSAMSTSMIGSRQFGGPIPETGMYMLHRGERISTKEESMGGIVVNINGGTYLDEDVAEQIGDMIIGKLKSIQRV